MNETDARRAVDALAHRIGARAAAKQLCIARETVTRIRAGERIASGTLARLRLQLKDEDLVDARLRSNTLEEARQVVESAIKGDLTQSDRCALMRPADEFDGRLDRIDSVAVHIIDAVFCASNRAPSMRELACLSLLTGSWPSGHASSPEQVIEREELAVRAELDQLVRINARLSKLAPST